MSAALRLAYALFATAGAATVASCGLWAALTSPPDDLASSSRDSTGDDGVADSASRDAGSHDRAPADGSRPDLGPLDSAARDRSSFDVGAADRNRPDGGVPGDATALDGGATCAIDPAAQPCGSVSVFRDNFDDNVPAAFWWQQTGDQPTLTLQESNGALRAIGTDATAARAHWVTWWSADLTDNAITVQADWSWQNEPVKANLVFRDLSGGRIGMGVNQDKIRGFTYRDSVWTAIGERPWDRATDRWWRIAKNSNNIVFSTSGDGCSWTWLGPVAIPGEFNLHGQIELGAEAFSMSPVSFTVRYDNLNSDRPAATWCAAGSMTDSFDSSVLAPHWLTEGGGDCTAQVVNNQLQVSATLARDDDCLLTSHQAFAVDAAGVTIELVSSVAANGVFHGLALWSPAGEIDFGRAGGELVVLRDHQVVLTVPYRNERYLRIRRDGDVAVFGSAGSDAVFGAVHQMTTPPPLDQVEVSIGLIGMPSLSSPTHTAFLFDNYNLAP